MLLRALVKRFSSSAQHVWSSCVWYKLSDRKLSGFWCIVNVHMYDHFILQLCRMNGIGLAFEGPAMKMWLRMGRCPSVLCLTQRFYPDKWILFILM